MNKCLYIQFEDKNYNIQKRLKQMLPYYNEKAGNADWHKNFILCRIRKDTKLFTDNISKIVRTMERENFYKGVVIIDNMYSSTDINIQENDDL